MLNLIVSNIHWIVLFLLFVCSFVFIFVGIKNAKMTPTPSVMVLPASGLSPIHCHRCGSFMRKKSTVFHGYRKYTIYSCPDCESVRGQEEC